MIRTTRLLAIALLACLAMIGAAWAAEAEKPLDNAEIVKLTKADMGDSVIIAKIKAATSVNFATSTDDLVKLKQAGVTKPVIAAMLEKTTPAAAPPPAPAAAGRPSAGGSDVGATITLHAKDNTAPLLPTDGDVKQIVAPFVGFKRFIIFDEVEAKVRTKDHRPSVTVASDRDKKSIWFVHVDQDKDAEDMNRSLDVESPGMWGGTMSSAPDGDMIVKCDVQEEKPGVFRLTPLKDLKPGEYGIYLGKGEAIGTLFDFGIDK
jgi:hypothetical protein